MFKFCPCCKSKLFNNKKIITCTKCDFVYYLNPSPSTAVILENEKGEVLFVKKNKPPKKGQWDLPGGFITFEETAEDGARREVKEELSIEINKLVYLGSYFGVYYPYKGVVYRPLCFAFSSKISGNIIKQIKTGDDASGYKFFSKDKIPLEKIAFVDVKNALKDYIR